MMNQKLKVLIFALLVVGSACAATAEQEHELDEHDHMTSAPAHDKEDVHGDEHAGASEGITLTPEQVALANIRVEKLVHAIMDYQVYAPGEIKANGYTSYQVSPRVDSVVLRRHVALGDQVKAGQSLVTLFSATVAEAQASYRVASSEWRRAEQLGRKAVGEKRYISAQTDYEAGYGRLLAFGLSKEAIIALTEKSQPLGEYTLVAAIAGAVLSDDFHQGQRVESGQPLIELADERELWVEARLAPNAHLELPAGSQAKIRVAEEFFPAVVTQEAHTIDPNTRTRVIRMLVINDSHRLHPGQFADVYFSFATDTPVLAVPESALMRGADGDWTVFVEGEPGEFRPQEVELGQSLGEWREISGVAEGAAIVMQGAFFVASQLAKGGFDPHGH
jgi:cobalt-zinc-cadmium efflux system membrane fusion protein